MKAGRLTRTPSAKVRGHALVESMKGLQIRARPELRARNCCKTLEAMCP